MRIQVDGCVQFDSIVDLMGGRYGEWTACVECRYQAPFNLNSHFDADLLSDGYI